MSKIYFQRSKLYYRYDTVTSRHVGKRVPSKLPRDTTWKCISFDDLALDHKISSTTPAATRTNKSNNRRGDVSTKLAC